MEGTLTLSRERETYQEEDRIEHCSTGGVMPPITIQATINSNLKLTTTTTPDTCVVWRDKFNKQNKHQNSIRTLYQNINGLSATPREPIYTSEEANSNMALWPAKTSRKREGPEYSSDINLT